MTGPLPPVPTPGGVHEEWTASGERTLQAGQQILFQSSLVPEQRPVVLDEVFQSRFHEEVGPYDLRLSVPVHHSSFTVVWTLGWFSAPVPSRIWSRLSVPPYLRTVVPGRGPSVTTLPQVGSCGRESLACTDQV